MNTIGLLVGLFTIAFCLFVLYAKWEFSPVRTATISKRLYTAARKANTHALLGRHVQLWLPILPNYYRHRVPVSVYAEIEKSVSGCFSSLPHGLTRNHFIHEGREFRISNVRIEERCDASGIVIYDVSIKIEEISGPGFSPLWLRCKNTSTHPIHVTAS